MGSLKYQTNMGSGKEIVAWTPALKVKEYPLGKNRRLTHRGANRNFNDGRNNKGCPRKMDTDLIGLAISHLP